MKNCIKQDFYAFGYFWYNSIWKKKQSLAEVDFGLIQMQLHKVLSKPVVIRYVQINTWHITLFCEFIYIYIYIYIYIIAIAAVFCKTCHQNIN